MSFGDWELFRMVVTTLRENEVKILSGAIEEGPRSVRFTVGNDHHKDQRVDQSHSNIQRVMLSDEKKSTSRTDGPSRRDQVKHSVMEKQVGF